MTFVLRKKETTTITSIKLTSILKFEILHFSDNIRKIPMIQGSFFLFREKCISHTVFSPLTSGITNFFRCEFGGLQVLFHFLSQKKSPAKNLVFVQSVSVSQSFFVSVVFFFFEGSRSFDRLIGGTSSLLLAPE